MLSQIQHNTGYGQRIPFEAIKQALLPLSWNVSALFKVIFFKKSTE